MKELTFEDIKESNLRRLLQDEDLTRFQDLISFDTKLLKLLQEVVEEFKLPEALTKEAQEKWYKANFTKAEEAVIKFIAD